MTELLRVHSLTLTAGDKLLCQDLNLCVHERQSWGLLGRNGAGKTTLLHTLLRLRQPDAGSIELVGKELSHYSRRDLAQRVGLLLQDGMEIMPASVLETVMLGRYPHNRNWLFDNHRELEIARQALVDLDLAELAERQVHSLSGGERQRLAVAMLLVQQPQLFLLDEPSNHLDVAAQIRLLELLADRITRLGASLLMATHDINLAARCCDWILLMLDSGRTLCGPSEQILTEDVLSEAYQCRIRRFREGSLSLFYPA